MDNVDESEDKLVLLKIQNSKKTDQMIELVWDKYANQFRTEGLRTLFGVNEIRIESKNVLESLERYSYVLSFLFETMSTAEDLNLPYGYQNEFEFGNERYSLYKEGEYRVLKLVGEE